MDRSNKKYLRQNSLHFIVLRLMNTGKRTLTKTQFYICSSFRRAFTGFTGRSRSRLKNRALSLSFFFSFVTFSNFHFLFSFFFHSKHGDGKLLISVLIFFYHYKAVDL